MLLGLSNTAGVLAGVLGTAATGHILQHGQDSQHFFTLPMLNLLKLSKAFLSSNDMKCLRFLGRRFHDFSRSLPSWDRRLEPVFNRREDN